MDAMSVFENIRKWRLDRNINGLETQMTKLMEEAGELATAISHRRHEDIADAIGDCVVVLTNIADIAGLKIEDCIDLAYTEIKNRTGQTINGNFVKRNQPEQHDGYIVLTCSGCAKDKNKVVVQDMYSDKIGGEVSGISSLSEWSENYYPVFVVESVDDLSTMKERMAYWKRKVRGLKIWDDHRGNFVIRKKCPNSSYFAWESID